MTQQKISIEDELKEIQVSTSNLMVMKKILDRIYRIDRIYHNINIL